MGDGRRRVGLTNKQVNDAALSLSEKTRWVRLTGTDATSGEVVTFDMYVKAFLVFYDGAKYRANADVLVERNRVVSVKPGK